MIMVDLLGTFFFIANKTFEIAFLGVDCSRQGSAFLVERDAAPENAAPL